MKQVTIRSKTIPSNPRSGNYPAGSVISGGGGGNTTITGGGGSGVDIVKQSDSESFTDSNVLSSLRTMLEIRSRILAEADVVTEPTDDNMLSSLRAVAEIDKAIQKAMAYVEKTYLNKTKDDKAVGNYEFAKDITVGQLAKMLDLEVTQLATIAQAVVGMISSPVFVDGFVGEGYKIWKDIASGDWTMTLDRITVRKVMAVYELLIQRVRSVGGSMVMSQADGKIKTAEQVGSNYILTFEIGNTFQPNDLLRHQVFTGDSVKYYWVEVAYISGDTVAVPVSEFGDVAPTVGDEVVQMGNTRDTGRQSLIMMSAIEDGKPKIDLLDGVNSRSFEGKLKTRIGWIGDITDTRFPADKQPSGYGVYTDNLFARGVFVLSTGEDVLTKFAVIEGLFRSEISSIRDELQKKDNYLTNSAFASNTAGWATTNDIKLFTVDGKFLYLNRNFYSEKKQVADVVRFDAKSVLRVKNSGVRQLNAELSRRPESGAAKFFMSFRYRVMRAGVLSVGFSGQGLWQEMRLEATDDFTDVEYVGLWDGTGDFELRFTGDAYFYSLALTDNAFEDYITKFDTKFEQTDKVIDLLAQAVNEVDGKLESEIKITAEGIKLANERIDGTDGKIETIGIEIGGISKDLLLYVKVDGIISAINISKELIKIQAKNIDLNGIVTANNYFKIHEDGSMESTKGVFNEGVFSGSIETKFKQLNESDAIDLGDEIILGVRSFKLNKDLHIIAGAYNLLLPVDASYVGKRVCIVNNTEVYTRVPQETVVRSEDRSVILGYLYSIGQGDYSIKAISFLTGYIELVGLPFGGKCKWMITTLTSAWQAAYIN